MIGSTFTLGFNGSAVQRGLGQVSGMLGRVSRQIGIGAARQIGAGVTDLMGKIVTAIPEAASELMDWTGNLNDMSVQTGMSVQKLVLLEEELRLAGAEAADTSRIISMLSKNLYDASTEGGAAKDALNKLGFFADEFKGMKVDDAFYKIGKRVAELGPEFEGLESIMADIFGAKMGFKMIRFFRDFNAHQELAKNNVGEFAKFMGGPATLNIDKMGEGLERFTMFKRQAISILLDELGRVSGKDPTNRMFDFLDPEKARPMIQKFTSFLGRNLEVLLSQDLTTSIGDVFKNLGKSFGEGIKDSFKIDSKSLLPMMFGTFGQSGKGSEGNNAATRELSRHTALLERIEQKVGIATFA